MKRIGFLLVMAALLSGCATMAVSKLTADNRLNLVHLSRGMSKPKVLAIMGSRVSIYNCDQAASKVPLKVTINNPYRTEMIETSGRTLEIIYYVTGLNNNNCAIEEDELTPLVFEDAKLIGWGKEFLLEIVPAKNKAMQLQSEQPVNLQVAVPAVAEKAQVEQNAPESAKPASAGSAQKTAETSAAPQAGQLK